MSRTLILTHHYAAPARDVWAIATDVDAYEEVMGRLMSFDGLPSGRIAAGQRIEVRVSLFGVMPWQDYVMSVEDMDDTEMWFQSDEHGAGVKSWRHNCSVEEIAGGCRLTDRVEIDAGWLTPMFVWWAGVVYRARHKPRVRMLAQKRG